MARKEIKGELVGLRKTVAAQRSEIAALKKDMKALHAQLKSLQKSAARQSQPVQPTARDTAAPVRRRRSFHFNAEALTAKRAQLGISQQAMATLLEASSLSVGRWEAGKVVPRAAQLERIQAVLKLGKREAKARLQGQL